MEINILTAKELADLLKLKESTICRLAAEGHLPGFKIGKAWRFDMEDVKHHLEVVKSLFGPEQRTGGGSSNIREKS